MKVILSPKTRKAKQRIKNHDHTCEVICETSTVDFSPIPGPWLLIHSPLSKRHWIHRDHDPDFRVSLIH